jgi:hypothetical protein
MCFNTPAPPHRLKQGQAEDSLHCAALLPNEKDELKSMSDD